MSFAVMINHRPAAELTPKSRDSTIEIPAGVLAGCAKCAETSGEETRYVLNVVRVEASGRKRRAIAMDGRQGIVAEWDAAEAVNDVALIPRDACTSRLVERSPDGVLLETNHERRLANLYVRRDDGRRYGIVAELVEGKVSSYVPPLVPREDVLKPTKSRMFVSIRVDAKRLARLAEAVTQAASDDDYNAVTLYVPLGDDTPLVIEAARNDLGVAARGCLMPLARR